MKALLRVSVVLALTAVLLVAWARGVDRAALLESIEGASWTLLILAGFVGGLHVPARALRWRTLLDVGVEPPPFRELVLTTAVGYLVTFVIPGRIGEVVRPALLSRRSEVELGAALGSVLFERLLDVGALLLMLAVFVLASPELAAGDLRTWTWGLLGAAALGLALGVFVHRRWRGKLDLVVSFVARKLPGRLGVTAERLGITALRGFDSLLKPGAWWRLGLLSLLTWTPNILCFALTMAACHTLEPWTSPLLLTVAGALGIAIPTPAGIGGFENVLTFTMESWLATDAGPAAATALLVHVTSVLPVFLLGLYYFLREGLSVDALKSAAAAREDEPEPAAESESAT